MMETENNSEYLSLVKRNDPVAWQQLIRMYYPVLLRFANKILTDSAAAEDTVMEVFTILWQQNRSFKEVNQLKEYLYVTTRNKCLNLIRSKRREKERNELFSNQYLSQEQIDAHLIYADVLAEIRKEIDLLSPKLRQIFVLAYLQRLTNDEIASQLQLSNQTVRNQKAAALAFLRKAIKKKFPMEIILIILFLVQ
jgi:RNA polymerase sigma-70 factor (ECF subfamily)